jgi:hypothetical protein
MKDALIAAAVELGQLPLSQWEAELEKPCSDGMKHFFKVAAVREMKTFLTVVARIMPLHNETSGNTPKYVTRDQIIERLREAGMPESMIDEMKPLDGRAATTEAEAATKLGVTHHRIRRLNTVERAIRPIATTHAGNIGS